MLLKQIFVENGEAIKFHIDSSIANINARAALSARIMVSYCCCVCNRMAIDKLTLALWRGSQCVCSDGTCGSCGSKHRGLSASSEELPGGSWQICRVLSMGQEVCRKGRRGIYTTRV